MTNMDMYIYILRICSCLPAAYGICQLLQVLTVYTGSKTMSVYYITICMPNSQLLQNLFHAV